MDSVICLALGALVGAFMMALACAAKGGPHD